MINDEMQLLGFSNINDKSQSPQLPNYNELTARDSSNISFTSNRNKYCYNNFQNNTRKKTVKVVKKQVQCSDDENENFFKDSEIGTDINLKQDYWSRSPQLKKEKDPVLE